jgi:hypothetical protein
MSRARWLIAALLCLPLPVGAQDPEWKLLTCTVEYPAEMRGNVMAIYFSESGQVRVHGTQHRATVNSAEIRFCLPATGAQSLTWYAASRTSGKLLGIPLPSSVECCQTNTIHLVTGRCTPEGVKPKF